MARRAWLLAALAILSACTGATPPSPSGTADVPTQAATSSMSPMPAPTSPNVPSSDPEATPSPSDSPAPTAEPLPADLPRRVVQEIELRRRYGYRFDVAWVLAVRDDPRAYDDGFGFRALPEEYEEQLAEVDHVMSFVDVVRAYGVRHPDEFQDLYLDWEVGKVMTVWTANVDGHLAAMLEEAGADAPIGARIVGLTKAQQRRISDGIHDDAEWLRAQQAVVYDMLPEFKTDRLEIDVSSANPEIVTLVTQRYARLFDVPESSFVVLSDGTGVHLLGRGTAKVVVELADGSAPGPNDLSIDFQPDGAGFCHNGDIGIGVGWDGRFAYSCTEGGWTVRIQVRRDGARELQTVGRAHVTVVADDVAKVRVRLEPGTDVREDR